MTVDPNIVLDPETMTLRFSYEAKAGIVTVTCDKTVDLEPLADAIEQRILQRLQGVASRR